MNNGWTIKSLQKRPTHPRRHFSSFLLFEGNPLNVPEKKGILEKFVFRVPDIVTGNGHFGRLSGKLPDHTGFVGGVQKLGVVAEQRKVNWRLVGSESENDSRKTIWKVLLEVGSAPLKREWK